MRKGWAPGATAFTSFFRTTLQSSLPIGSFLVKIVFSVPMLEPAPSLIGMTSLSVSIVTSLYQRSSKNVSKTEKTITKRVVFWISSGVMGGTNVPLDTKYPPVYAGMTCRKGRGNEEDQRPRVTPSRRLLIGVFVGRVRWFLGLRRSMTREAWGILASSGE